MKHVADSIAHGVAAFSVATIAGLQDFGVKLLSSLIIVVITSVVSHVVKKGLRRRDWSKKAKEYHAKHPKQFPHDPPPH